MIDPLDPMRPRRRSIRLRGYDYSRAGAYFVTVCARDRACVFGDVADDEVALNSAGRIVQATWDALPKHFPGAATDAYVVMPNHVHGIIVLTGNDAGVTNHAPTQVIPVGARFIAPALGAIVRSFKARSTHSINALRGTAGVPVWQRNYYEHIIRDDEEMERVRRYIADNPCQWANDRENPLGIASNTATSHDTESWQT